MKLTMIAATVALAGCVSSDTPPKPAGEGFLWYFSTASAPQFPPMDKRSGDSYWTRSRLAPVGLQEKDIEVVYTPVMPTACGDANELIGCAVYGEKRVYVNASALGRYAGSPAQYARALKCLESHEKAHLFGFTHGSDAQPFVPCAPGEGVAAMPRWIVNGEAK